MPLPSNVSFGTVVGRFLTATADGSDADRDPDGIAATGLSIVFSPSLTPALVRDASASPPAVFALSPVSATVGADGTLLGPDGAAGVRLVASSNPNLEPTGWPWTVQISGPAFPSLSFSFVLDPGVTVDLASVVQVPSGPGQTLAQWLQAVRDAQAARDAALAAAASTRDLQPLPITTSTAPVVVAADSNMDNLWPTPWWQPANANSVDLSAMTDPAVYGPWFYGGKAARDTWWGGGPAIYNALNVGTNPTWAFAARITGTTRLLVGMNGAVGAETASKFLIEVDGQKLTRRYVDTGIVYDGHRTGLLLTFPDARPHDVRIWSKAGYTHAVVDPGGTVGPSPTPFGGKKRLIIAGDSWIEGTSQAGGAVSLASMVQAACPEWNVAYLGNGGTGYVNTGPSFASAYGSSARLAAMSGFAPDLWVFFGSINDSDPTAVQAAASAAFGSLASSNPAARGVVVGPQLAGHDQVSAALAAAAAAAPNVLGYVDPVAAGWVAPAGVVGPSDVQHPSVVGADHLANRLIAAVRRLTSAAGDTSW